MRSPRLFLSLHSTKRVTWPELNSTSMAASPRSNEEKTLSLKAELDAFRSEFMAHVPREILCSDHALPEKNGDENWVLPIPATCVIDANGTVALSFVYVGYRNRLEPAEILTALHSLSKQQRGEDIANASR